MRPRPFKLLALGIAALAALTAGAAQRSSGALRAWSGDLGTCAQKATGSHTPHVGSGGCVFVDTQTWRVIAATSAKRLGSTYTRKTADGIFLVLRVRVTNGKSKSVTLNSDIAKLEVKGDEYSPDTDGLTALQLSGKPVLFLKNLGPHVTTTAWLAYDVPKGALRKAPEVCFHEIGYGSSKGCIRVVVG
jgi:hypothetical protein